MTYTIALKPAGKGQVTATSSDGFRFLTTTPLCDGARYWLGKGIDPATCLVTIWSSASTDWALRSTVGYAARHTVLESPTEGPRSRKWSPFPTRATTEAVSS
jgi:hypothetical protein